MKQKQQHAMIEHSVKMRLWLNTFILGFILYVLFVIASTILDGVFTLSQFSKALAGVGAVMFGSSFALSGFCYYFDFLDKKIHYRKYLGLVGYFFAVLYSISLMVVNPDRYFYGFFENITTPDFILGLTAMALFTTMVLVSNPWIMKRLGPQLWRKFLRVGYIAWILLAVRAWAIEKEFWAEWFETFKGFPPPRLLMSLFVVAVILFRISMIVSKYYRHKRAVQ